MKSASKLLFKMSDLTISVSTDSLLKSSDGKRFRFRLFFKTIFHFLGCSAAGMVFGYGTNLWLGLTEEMMEHPAVYNFKMFIALYFTNWNVLFQTLFLTLALTHDILEWSDKLENSTGKRIRYWRDILFSGLVYPGTMFVVGMFWSIYWIDRELVYPSVFESIVPSWFNHCVHTNILVILALETILQARRNPSDVKGERIAYVSLFVIYTIVYYAIYFTTGRFLYKIFSVMNWWQLCLFQGLIWLSGYVFYKIQFPINRLFHGKEVEFESKMKVKQNGIGNKQNGAVSEDKYEKVPNGIEKKIVSEELKNNSLFVDESWRLKYRMIRNQFENYSR